MNEQTRSGRPVSLADLSDRELLTRFIRRHDQNAFCAIVARHGSMVMSLCRGMLRREQDAEDACQATFLVLAEKARRIRRRTSLASWLHGAAYRICLKASARIQRRKEEAMGDSMMIVDESLEEVADQHAKRVLHEELNGLPEEYRAVLVICYMEGKSREEAASQLGCSVGAIKGRLERGRQKLRTRLLARGMASAVFVGAMGGGAAATQALAESFIASTVDAAIAYASGQAVASGVSSQVIALAKGELSIMSASVSTKMLVASVSSVALLGVCLLLLMLPPAAKADKPVERGIAIQTAADPDDANSPETLVIAQASNEDKEQNEKSKDNGKIRGRGRVGKLIWTPDGKSLVFGGPVDPQAEPGEQAMDMWIFDQSRRVRLPATRERCFTVSRDSSTYVTLHQVVVEPMQNTNLDIRLYDLHQRGEPRRKLTVATGTRLFQTYGLEMSTDGKTLATCGFSFPEQGGQGDIFIIDLETGKLRALGQGYGAVYCLAFSPDGTKLATGRLIRDKTQSGIEVWNVEEGKLLHQWPTHRGMMWNMAFSPDGVRLASVGHSHDRRLGWEKFVSVHNLETGKLEHNLQGHEKSPSTVVFSPDGKLLATGGVDKVVNVWTVSTGKLVKTFTGHQGAVDGITFSPDGKKIASGDRQKSIRIWDVSEMKVHP